MGRRDEFMTLCYTKYITKVANLENVRSIAWLGWGGENIIVKDICRKCPNLEKNDLYDIDTTEDERVIKWDINKKWDISGYDLVICLRTAVFAKNAQHFASELGQAAATNKIVIFDFMLPELKFLMNYATPYRACLADTFNLPPHTDSYFSWYESRVNDDPNRAAAVARADHEYTTLKLDEEKRDIIKMSSKVVEYRNKGSEDGGYNMLPKFDRIYNEFFRKEVGIGYSTDRMSYVASNRDVFLTEKMITDNQMLMKNVEFYYTLNLEPMEYLSVLDAPDLPERWFFTLAVMEKAT